MAKKEKPGGATGLNPKKISKRIRAQIPEAKRKKWQKIGAKALEGETEQLQRLHKRGIISDEEFANAKKKSGGGKGGSDSKLPTYGGKEPAQKLGRYTPTPIREADIVSPPQINPPKYRDVITGLDVNAQFALNPYAGAAGGLAAQTAKPTPAQVAAKRKKWKKKAKKRGATSELGAGGPTGLGGKVKDPGKRKKGSNTGGVPAPSYTKKKRKKPKARTANKFAPQPKGLSSLLSTIRRY